MRKIINYLKKLWQQYLSKRPVSKWPLRNRIIRAKRLYKQKEGHTFDLFAP